MDRLFLFLFMDFKTNSTFQIMFKPCLFILFGTLAHLINIPSEAQTTIHVSGKHILGPCGDTLLLRGINYAPYNWGWSPDQLRINEIAKSKANCVRLVWYKTGQAGTPATTYENLVLLDSALASCIRHKLIPVLVLHDQTCQNSPTNLISMASWFSQTNVLQLIDKYRHNLILNLANEALYVNWASNPSAARIVFQNTYSTIVNSMRVSGIHVPLMIDGPDCGTNLEVLAQVGPVLLQNDPDSNLIFSAHGYWFSYAGNDSTQMVAKIEMAQNAGIPFLFGEVANLQDGTINCEYVLNYRPLLHICQQKKIGWLAWSWDNDVCAQRQISSNGQFSSLTNYGQSILNDPDFGLITDSVAKSKYLVSGDCVVTGRPYSVPSSTLLYPNPGGRIFRIDGPIDRPIRIVSSLGESIPFYMHREGESLEIRIPPTAKAGLYFLQTRGNGASRILIE